jgi:hypothetical protein
MIDPTLDPDYYTEVTCSECHGDGCDYCDGTGVELVGKGETEGSGDEE